MKNNSVHKFFFCQVSNSGLSYSGQNQKQNKKMTQQVKQYLEEKVTFTQSWEHNQFWPGLSKGYFIHIKWWEQKEK